MTLFRWHAWMYGSDTGTFAQVILNAPVGFVDGPERGSHFAYHFSPLLAALYPLLAVLPSGLTLQLGQVVLLAAVAPALYVLALPYVGDKVAVWLAALALAYPPLLAVSFEEFHEIAFFPVLIVLLVLAADRERWGWFAVVAVLALLVREDANLTLALVGAGLCVLGLVRRSSDGRGLLLGAPRAPARLAVAGAALAIGAVAVDGGYYAYVHSTYGQWPHGHFYHYIFADGPAAVAASIVTHPVQLAAAVLTLGRGTYLLEAFAPLALLPLRTWWTLAALPAFAVVLLASDQSVWRMGNHYAALWLPWLLIAVVAWAAAHTSTLKIPLIAALALCAVVLVFFDPMHPLHYLRPAYPDHAAAAAALACAPAPASLSTHDEWFARIAAQRLNATIAAVDGVDYLVYADDYPNATYQAAIKPGVAREIGANKYASICRFGNVATYRLRSP